MSEIHAMPVPTQKTQIQTLEDAAMPIENLVRQVALIQDVMQKVMREDEHYGIIPGTDKPTLYKPGAEKLSLTFRLAPTYHVERIDLPKGHREYIVRCTLTHIPTGQLVGEGVGSCTTMESKYRYRWDPTGKPVPKKYWDTRDPAVLGGPQYAPRKKDGAWMIYQRVEHDNPADYYNTVLKMAKKRAHVDAILTATAASDIFTQDLEDLPIQDHPATDEAPKPRQSARSARNGKSQSKTDPLDVVLQAAAEAGLTEQDLLAHLGAGPDERLKDFSTDALRQLYRDIKAGRVAVTGEPEA